jgi:hypothetical protein
VAVRVDCKISIKIPKERGIRAIKNKCPVLFKVFLFSNIITDIKPKYIEKCTILSAKGKLKIVTLSNVCELVRLRYIIIRATRIENIFFFNIFNV